MRNPSALQQARAAETEGRWSVASAHYLSVAVTAEHEGKRERAATYRVKATKCLAMYDETNPRQGVYV